MADSNIKENSDHPVKKLHHYSPKEVAEELSLMDAELLRRIAPEELENGAWMKKDKKHQLSPNIMAMVGSFNQLALLVPTEILNETTPQARAKVITTFIQIASKCHSHHNYNSLKAVLAGLQCTPIFRLNKTWKDVSSKRKKRFNLLTKLMSEEQNWLVYRKELEPKLQSKTPFIPFLGVFLTDVALSQEATSMSKRIGNKMSVGSKTDIKRDMASRRSSTALYETYTILEPITIRNRLEKLRSMTSQDHYVIDSEPSTSAHSDSDKEDADSTTDTDSFYSCQSSRNSLPSPNHSFLSPSKTSSPSSHSASSPLRLSSSPGRLSSPIHPSASPTSSDFVEEWDVNEWLMKIGLDQYTEGFIDNGYETVELCASLSGKDMNAIGILDKHHRSILFTHARMLLEVDSCPIGSPRNDRSPTKLPDPSASQTSDSAKPRRPKLGAIKGTESFSRTLSGSLECLMSAVQLGGVSHSETYEHPDVLLKSTSLHTLNSQDLDSDISNQTHKRTGSDTQVISNGTTKEKEPLQNFSGLPPQLPLHSQATLESTEYSPNKEAKSKIEHSPIKDTSIKFKNWLHSPLDHHGKASFPLIKRTRDLLHTSSVPVLLQRPRRSSAAVPRLRASQIATQKEENKDPIDVLATYQFLSLGCVVGVESNHKLRIVLTQSTHNTEGQNYKLSYQRETE